MADEQDEITIENMTIVRSSNTKITVTDESEGFDLIGVAVEDIQSKSEVSSFSLSVKEAEGVVIALQQAIQSRKAKERKP